MAGIKPKGKVKLEWSPNFAYAIGLLATDGNLSPDGRHISLVSKDIEQVNNFIKCLGLDVKVGKTTSGYNGNSAHRVQFGDVLFYDFLETIGLYANKSKTISSLNILPQYFFDFLRGSFDGDGCFYSYWDKRWRSSHMFYMTFSSASMKHIEWLKEEIIDRTGSAGHISKAHSERSIYNLRCAKKEALVIIKKMYYNRKIVCLSRKRVKIEKALAIEKKQQKLYSR